MEYMNQDFITYLTIEISAEIMSRLPHQTTLCCKCVCKSWRDLIENHEFAKLLISKSVPALALTVNPDWVDRYRKHTDGIHVQHHNFQDLQFTTLITELYYAYSVLIRGSVDGLLLLQVFKGKRSSRELHLCNPTTREYIDLLHSNSQPFDPLKFEMIIYGFGVSQISGQYKVVVIFYDPRIKSDAECKVYTIGTGSWRNIAPPALARYIRCTWCTGAFVKGNIHWLAGDYNGTFWICCFDLETELFSVFSPRLFQNEKNILGVRLVVVEGTLCVCAYTGGWITIWLMKEYGIEKSWTKAFIIAESSDLRSKPIYPIRFFEDGIILTKHYEHSLFYYSSKNKIITRIYNFTTCVYVTSASHIPSFLSLKGFRMENSKPL